MLKTDWHRRRSGHVTKKAFSDAIKFTFLILDPMSFHVLYRRSLRPALLGIVLFCGSVSFAKESTDTTRIVALVGKNEITFQDFVNRYEDYLIFTGLQDNVRARYAVLNNMINEILFREYDNNAKVYGNPEYKKEITSAWNRTVLAFLKDREVYAKITVTNRELREAYQRSKIKLAVRHLYARTEKDAENLYRLAVIGVSFHELAKQAFTDSTLRNNGGYLGYITWGDADANFETMAYSLKIGEVSRPVKTAEGYSIIRVDDRIEDPFATETGFLNQKRKLERAIRIDKKKPYEKAYLDKVIDQSKVKFSEKGLRAVFDELEKIKPHDLESSNRTSTISEDCVEYKGRKYSQSDIVNKILEFPGYNRSRIKNVQLLKGAILGLLMQDALVHIAKEKGYDTTSSVKETFTKLANDIYLSYKRNEILDVVPVSDSEVTKYYADNISYYTSEREMNVQEIIVGSDSTARVIREKLDLGEDFGLLAGKSSLRKWSAKNKGVMGLSPISNFGELKDTLWSLPLGKVLGPLQFEKYYGMFRVLNKENGHPIDVNVVRDQIVKAVKNEKGFPYMKRRLESLSKETTIKVNDEIVKNYTIKLAGK